MTVIKHPIPIPALRPSQSAIGPAKNHPDTIAPMEYEVLIRPRRLESYISFVSQDHIDDVSNLLTGLATSKFIQASQSLFAWTALNTAAS